MADVRDHLEGGTMTHLPDNGPSESLTGLTPEAAKELHGLFVVNTISFTLIAIVAHGLVWFWRPWLGA
ncbi:light-harvesting antenna LH1, beta subunit [Brevundimonas variabilis]|uniref:Light-harvesting complex 1 beta chain n=1 Tax=Brevundimonas variabilis TaxID=74312 RepID=A0A7W9FG24_9CAUL|nr:light-harvesting complex 1 beta chain [Brevundimonas variabilis]